MAGNIKTQADQRREINPKDQFGRRWGGTIEIATGDPTGAFVPCGFPDNLCNTKNYLRTYRDEFGNVDLSRVEVNFPLWVRDIEEAERSWYEQLHRNAIHVYKSIEPEKVATLDQDKFLMDLTGPKPFPSSDVLRAAMAGDRQYLGFEPLDRAHREALRMETLEDLKSSASTPTVVDVASDLPPDTYPEFLKWVFARGTKSMKEAAALWQEHRKNLQAV